MTVFIGSDYTKRKDTWMQIAIGPEDDPIELRILPPTVGAFMGLQEVSKFILKELSDEGDGSENVVSLGDALAYVAQVMSNNMDSRVFTAKQLDEMGFNVINVAQFVTEFTEFMVRLIDEKN